MIPGKTHQNVEAKERKPVKRLLLGSVSRSALDLPPSVLAAMVYA